MSGAIYTITPEDAVRLFPDAIEEVDPRFFRWSQPLLVGYYQNQPACLAGIVPETMTSDTAYVWGWSTDIVKEHPVLYARWSRRLITRALSYYPNIVGHCYRRQGKWLRFLGAEITDVGGDMLPFQIKGLN